MINRKNGDFAMKTKEELNVLRTELQTLKTELNGLDEDELALVTGGSTESDLAADFFIYLSKAGVALTRAAGTLGLEQTERRQACRDALDKTREALQEKLANVPWNLIKITVNKALEALNGLTGEDFAIARTALETCINLLAEY